MVTRGRSHRVEQLHSEAEEERLAEEHAWPRSECAGARVGMVVQPLLRVHGRPHRLREAQEEASPPPPKFNVD
jgi:hypothetical protein